MLLQKAWYKICFVKVVTGVCDVLLLRRTWCIVKLKWKYLKLKQILIFLFLFGGIFACCAAEKDVVLLCIEVCETHKAVKADYYICAA